MRDYVSFGKLFDFNYGPCEDNPFDSSVPPRSCGPRFGPWYGHHGHYGPFQGHECPSQYGPYGPRNFYGYGPYGSRSFNGCGPQQFGPWDRFGHFERPCFNNEEFRRSFGHGPERNGWFRHGPNRESRFEPDPERNSRFGPDPEEGNRRRCFWNNKNKDGEQNKEETVLVRGVIIEREGRPT